MPYALVSLYVGRTAKHASRYGSARRLALLRPAEPARTASSPAISAAAGWRISPHAADPDQDGAELTAIFAGRGMAVEVQRGPYAAICSPGLMVSPRRYCRRMPRATLSSLYDPENGVAVIPLAADLTPGEH